MVEKVKVWVAQSCPTLCDPMDYSLPVSSVHGILQARTLEWVAILFSREYSWLRDQTQVSCIAGRFFTVWVTKKAPANAEDGRDESLIPGLRRSLGVENGTLFQYFCLKIPGTEEPDRLQAMGLQKVIHNRATGQGGKIYSVKFKNNLNRTYCPLIMWRKSYTLRNRS